MVNCELILCCNIACVCASLYYYYNTAATTYQDAPHERGALVHKNATERRASVARLTPRTLPDMLQQLRNINL